jgi:hypothetical protein
MVICTLLPQENRDDGADQKAYEATVVQRRQRMVLSMDKMMAFLFS